MNSEQAIAYARRAILQLSIGNFCLWTVLWLFAWSPQQPRTAIIAAILCPLAAPLNTVFGGIIWRALSRSERREDEVIQGHGTGNR
jgi:hypothetical protein